MEVQKMPKIHSQVRIQIEKQTARTLRKACEVLKLTPDATRADIKKYSIHSNKYRWMTSNCNDQQNLFFDNRAECLENHGSFEVKKLPLFNEDGESIGEHDKWVARGASLWDLTDVEDNPRFTTICRPDPLPQEKPTAQNKPRNVDYVFLIVEKGNENATVYISPSDQFGIPFSVLFCFPV